MLIHTCHAMPMPRCAVALRSRFENGMVVAWHGRGMACANQTWPHCVNQMGKTQYKPLAARHGRGMGTAWARHGICELAFNVTEKLTDNQLSENGLIQANYRSSLSRFSCRHFSILRCIVLERL
jgi:hypothetical protein